MPTIKIFSGKASLELAKKISNSYGKELGNCTSTTFNDGEINFSYDENIRGCDVFIIQATHSPAEYIVELLIMIDAAKRASAASITVVVPYYGYARQDRKMQVSIFICATD